MHEPMQSFFHTLEDTCDLLKHILLHLVITPKFNLRLCLITFSFNLIYLNLDREDFTNDIHQEPWWIMTSLPNWNKYMKLTTRGLIHPPRIIHLEFPLSKYNLEAQHTSALTINTLSYVQSRNAQRLFFFSTSVRNKLKARPVSKRPIHKGEKWGCGGDGEDQWKISADPLIPLLIYLSLLSADRFPLADLWEKKNVTVEWAFDKIVQEILCNKSWSLHPGCRLLSHSYAINKSH